MKKSIVFSFLCLLLFTQAVYAGTLLDCAVWMVTTDETVNFGWSDPSGVAESFDVRLLHVERNSYTELGSTAEKVWSFKLPRSGHFVAEVRSCKGATCSVWSRSDNLEFSPTVNGVVRAWCIYGYPAPPGQPVIDR